MSLMLHPLFMHAKASFGLMFLGRVPQCVLDTSLFTHHRFHHIKNNQTLGLERLVF